MFTALKRRKEKTSEKFTRTLKQVGGMIFVIFVMSSRHFYMSPDQLAKRVNKLNQNDFII